MSPNDFAVLCGLSLVSFAAAKFDDSGFLNWFDECLEEVNDMTLEFDAKVPDYVRGYLVQAGPASFKMGEYTMTHAFDGFGKVHRLHFGADGVRFSANFLQSSFYTESKKHNRVVPAMMAGNTIPSQGFGPKGALAGANDNNDVKCHKIGAAEMYLSDTPVAAVFKDNFESLDHVTRPALFGIGTKGIRWDDNISPAAHICATGIMAHGETNPHNGNFVGSVACLSPLDMLHPSDYHVVFQINPTAPEKREVLRAIKLKNGRRASYMHSMAQTQNHVVLIAQPLHMSLTAVLEGKGLGDGSIVLGNDTTFQAVDLVNGSLREWHHPGFLFSHIQNSWEEGDDIVIDLTWYQPDWHMAFLGMFKFENLQKQKRDAWPVNKLMRYRLKKDGTVEETDLLPHEPKSLWELPIVNPLKHGKQEACVTWFIQGACNAYDEEVNSTKVGPTGAYGLAKRNLCTGERLGWYAPNEYPSEVTFVPNPDSAEEDSGALIGFVFDANKNSSYVHVRDAKSLKMIARADLPIRTPFLVHASWFPEGTKPQSMVLV